MSALDLEARSPRQAVDVATRCLRDAGVPSPEVDASLLVRHVLQGGAGRLGGSQGEVLGTSVASRLSDLVRRRAAREPLQLILGSVGFRYLELAVDPGVFIPRPETEVLAGEALVRVPPRGVVVDLCTGTGAVAIAVATEGAPAEVHATDVSPEAVDLARRNAAAAGAEVVVHRGDLLDPLPRRLRGAIDVLVANPPYVAADELDQLPPEVADWDPHRALVAGPTGHEVTDRVIAAAAEWLVPGGWVLLEVAQSRASATAARASAAGLAGPTVLADLTGRERIVVARAPS